ncbi:hypothetical protein GCM10009662_01080 [Catellatospora coxensis]|uniref:Uncharacterized protein n=1 Tax=Catellatospora coxensis TaxID=310354 RepID=A0A8J3KRQ7_9ACTN|nr:hypothetical protein Cco03nite_04490 [Catellatospora coxensis]
MAGRTRPWHHRPATSGPDETQRLRDLALLHRVPDRMDREYAQPLDVEALARLAHARGSPAPPDPPRVRGVAVRVPHDAPDRARHSVVARRVPLPNNIAFKQTLESYRLYLASEYRVGALIGVPAGALAGTTFRAVLLVIDRAEPAETFVAQLGEDWATAPSATTSTKKPKPAGTPGIPEVMAGGSTSP